MDKYIKYSDIPFCKIELEERCHNDRWTEIHEVAYKTEIDRIPAANVAPVRYGCWNTDKEDVEWGNSLIHYRCSVCNERPHFDREKYKFILSPYCPNCGAKMDKDGVEE